jgi:hypothetical protein
MEKVKKMHKVVNSNNASPSIIATIESNNRLQMKRNLAKHPSTPPSTLRKLFESSSDDDWLMQVAMATNPNTPLKILNKLALSDDVDVKTGLLENPSITSQILTKLYTSPNYGLYSSSVQMHIVKHPNASPELLIKLASEKNSSLYNLIAKHPNCPNWVKIMIE